MVDEEELIAKLQKVFGETYCLFTKTQNYHWNISGPLFMALQKMFKDQYLEIFAALDLIVERLRTKGARVDCKYSSFLVVTKIREPEGKSDATMMLRDLARDQDSLVDLLMKTVVLAQRVGDEATAALLTDRIAAHEKNRWFLRMHIL